MEAGYVVAPLLGAVVSAAEQLGFDRDALLIKLGLDDSTLSDPDHLLPPSAERAIWAELVRGGDTSVGIRVAEQFPHGSLRAIEYLVCTSASLAEGIGLIPRFTYVSSGQPPPTLENVDAGLRVIDHRDYDVAAPAEIAEMEAVIALFIFLVRRATGVPFTPAELTFRHARSSSAEAYALLGSNVAFDRPRTTLFIDRETLAQPMRDADPTLHDILARAATKRITELPHEATMLARVTAALFELLPRHEPSLDAVSKRLAMSGRAIQRKLQAEETTFRAVVERAREQLAKRYLADTNLTALDVAILLEYSDGASFNRAFRRWTGMSPGAYRASLRNS